MVQQNSEPQEQTFGSYLLFERKQAGLTLRDLAKVSGLAASTLSRWENDKVAPSRADVIKVDRGLKADGRILAHWELATSIGFPPWMKNVSRLEEAAKLIELISPHLIPGLLQSPRYARAVLREGLHPGTPEEISRLVALRCGRYKHLRNRNNPRITAVFPLTALTCLPCSVRGEQVAHLLSLAGNEEVSIHLVPEETTLLGVVSMLIMFHLADGGKAAVSDHVDGATLYEDKRSYDRLHGLVKHALGSALPPTQSLKVLKGIQ
ncbi:helix-turn-helix transcriptional regulator [Nocardiopsis sp. FIRDI 009]|uniref:helix-turn-helix domain-containing protein n=1 Tax=Nocardiopsis sp. FIRDI 009 TaxID=714197 RepID=UPI000E220025|nr:helix-turn-helix transcriptional regulator [Nocardiopsis sp. FIRDI 009]